MLAWLKKMMGDGPRVYEIPGWAIVAYLRATGYGAGARLGRALR